MKRAKALGGQRNGLAKAMACLITLLFFQAVFVTFVEFMHGGWCAEH